MEDLIIKITHTNEKFTLKIGDTEIENVTGYTLYANTQSRLVCMNIETAIALGELYSDNESTNS